MGTVEPAAVFLLDILCSLYRTIRVYSVPQKHRMLFRMSCMRIIRMLPVRNLAQFFQRFSKPGGGSRWIALQYAPAVEIHMG